MTTISNLIARMKERERRFDLIVRFHRGWHGSGPLRECGDLACQEAFHEYIGQYETASEKERRP